MGRVLAAYGGGFKPPTRGHFEIVQKALNEFPEIDEFFIYVGGKERDGIDQAEAIQVWEIYKKYLANKVDIQPAKQPIKSVLDLAKENPQDIIYFILGYREGREDDTQDIINRSKLEEKYPNLVVKTLGTPDPNMSGTNARKAIADEEEFIKFLPDEVEEKSEIWNIIRPAVNEDDPKKGTGKKPEGSKRRLYTDEDPKDTVGIKFSTRQDIVDTLGKASFKAKSHARQSQIINLIHQRVRAAYGRAKDPKVKKRLKTGLDYITDKKEASKKKTQRLKNQKENIDPKSQSKHKGKSAPFGSAYEPVKEGDTYEKMAAKGKKSGNLKQGTVRKRLGIAKDKKIPLSKINKEISRLKKMDKDKDKKGVQLGDKNQKYYKALQLSKTLKTTTNINENATYSKKIDLINNLASLTQHMLDKGMNIEPLPKLEFINGDVENASQFLGKTAYYDPNTQTIVLYTEGRHPKDITRSYAHEMIHHIQNLEGRLGNIQTTNTLEDDYLNDIEAEANLKGTMTFRNWTDSLLNGDNLNENEEDNFDNELESFAKQLGSEIEDEIEEKGGLKEAVGIVGIIGWILLSNTVANMLSKFAKKQFAKYDFGKGEAAAKKIYDFTHKNEEAFKTPIKRIVGLFTKNEKYKKSISDVLYAILIFMMAGQAGGDAVSYIKKAGYLKGGIYALKSLVKGKEVHTLIKGVIEDL